ncbi:restriction endonuclease subunit S [Psychrobacter sp. UBA2514]|jgi:type I restriction enzyme S subunit|uniref:restriction endonuclease subunit S n=1 Tax=Psychrobacter sp. UBA2514 TaxID=1947346 RepID=UPI00257A906C|nr:restriction endonuclease subunit S [Psychrobacter sp. UBA2514]|tara:strand:- start:7271 stop:8497 length:1227 start_codon:yes stop_codon:yes gene_type:complete
MVPKGWEVRNLENLASVERGKFSARPRNDPKYYGGEIPFVQTGDIAGAKTYLKSYSQTLNEEGLKVSRLFPKDTILITIAANIGDVAITSFDVACPDSLVAIQPKEGTNVIWLYFYLETCQKELDGQATQNAQKNINLQVLRPLEVLTPPLPEQQKIAKILSTWDKAISTTERLIENSTQQKKALMQQLLTGKKRLLNDDGKRFEDEWEEGLLGDLVDVTTGYAFKSNEFVEHKNDSYSIVRMSDLKEGVLNLTQSARVPKSTVVGLERYKLSEGDFIFGMSGSLDNYATVKNVDLPCYLNQRVGKIRAKSNSNQDFVSYIYLSDRVRESILNKAAGAAQLNISIGDLRKTSIRYPNKKEQQKIATVLINADKEIDLLEQQLADLQQEKKALMQVLLTGKKRVVVDVG